MTSQLHSHSEIHSRFYGFGLRSTRCAFSYNTIILMHVWTILYVKQELTREWVFTFFIHFLFQELTCRARLYHPGP